MVNCVVNHGPSNFSVELVRSSLPIIESRQCHVRIGGEPGGNLCSSSPPPPPASKSWIKREAIVEAVVEWDVGDVLDGDRVMFGYVTDTKYMKELPKN